MEDRGPTCTNGLGGHVIGSDSRRPVEGRPHRGRDAPRGRGDPGRRLAHDGLPHGTRPGRVDQHGFIGRRRLGAWRRAPRRIPRAGTIAARPCNVAVPRAGRPCSAGRRVARDHRDRAGESRSRAGDRRDDPGAAISPRGRRRPRLAPGAERRPRARCPRNATRPPSPDVRLGAVRERSRPVSIDQCRPPARDRTRAEAGHGATGHSRRLDGRLATFALAHAVRRSDLDRSMGSALQASGPTSGMATTGLMRRARLPCAAPCRRDPPPIEASTGAAACGRCGGRPARGRGRDRSAPHRVLLGRARPDGLAQ